MKQLIMGQYDRYAYDYKHTTIAIHMSLIVYFLMYFTQQKYKLKILTIYQIKPNKKRIWMSWTIQTNKRIALTFNFSSAEL